MKQMLNQTVLQTYMISQPIEVCRRKTLSRNLHLYLLLVYLSRKFYHV